MRLHLHSINTLNVTSKDRAMCLGLSMFWFASIWGVNQTLKRNLTMKMISNMSLSKLLLDLATQFKMSSFIYFIVLKNDRSKIRHCASEHFEHVIDKARQGDREFVCSNFSTMQISRIEGLI